MLFGVFESENERMENEWREGGCVFIDELVPRFKAFYPQLKLVTLNFCFAGGGFRVRVCSEIYAFKSETSHFKFLFRWVWVSSSSSFRDLSL